MKKVSSVLGQNKALEALIHQSNDIVTNETSDEAYLLASSFLRTHQTMIVVKENRIQAMRLYQAVSALINDVVVYPADESLRIEAVAYSYELLAERINALYQLTRHPVICIAHTHSVTRYLPSPELFNDSIMHLHVGDVIEPIVLREHLRKMGYMMTQRVDSPFYMAKRGGVMDVYSIQYDDPIRIEFFDDEIDSISFFDKDTQRRKTEALEVSILPATDMLYDEEQSLKAIEGIQELMTKVDLPEEMKDELQTNITMDIESLKAFDYEPRIYQYMAMMSQHSIFEYAPQATIITASYQGILNQYKDFTSDTFRYIYELHSVGQMLKGLKLVLDPQPLLKKRIDFVAFKEKDNQIPFNAHAVEIALINEHAFLVQLKDYLAANKVVICVETERQLNSVSQYLDNVSLPYVLADDDAMIYDGITLYRGELKRGIELVDEHVVFLTSYELFKSAPAKKRVTRYKDAVNLRDYNELNVGDYVVHDSCGIGRYVGIQTLLVDDVHRDYLKIAYKGMDVLYVPVENFKLIRKYVSRDGKAPRLHAMNSPKWQREKARVRQKVDGLADELIALYAQRMAQEGFAFSPDDDYQLEFESRFGYELTPDQLRSVEEIKADMEKPQPMDRLLCGDVGFGKTEVALRACFKAILNDKQCAFLCPTTILSQQHYNTMLERFKEFPVTVALLNRFTSTKERNQILHDLKHGRIDLLVGTHRILSKDVRFKDLGLLCIDEEQRFGVRQKETIKELKKTVDVLTLTATPIPRTLQMSLMGIRGLSTIDTPPLNRLPVQTYVSERSLPLIKQVIERELGRNGQVFYLFNNTERIEEVALTIRNLVPYARIGVGHGQMDKRRLEKIMQDFVEGKYDVLVCTTIIETGIDIPNANTIIVEDADRFGLAQLYQIRGRVGRSERLAYAYLLYRRNKQMTEEAAKRLKAIKEFTQLGSGYKIAMRDLSIRGAGDILGSTQAGFIDTVGFDMYMKILQDAIDEKQGTPKKETDVVPSRNLKVDGYIPDDYVDNDIEKIDLYNHIYEANTLEELSKVEVELKDLYGHIPIQINNIVIKRRFEILSHDVIIEDVNDYSKGLAVTFTKDFSDSVDGVKLFEHVYEFLKNAKLQYTQKRIIIDIPIQDDYVVKTSEFLNDVIMHKENYIRAN
ncbi:MAG: transcription-repair coupling factor [Erysipelotrichaceae bacterium]|nr:transcription-repair coupling factor [Erysipelotrichaceae bacterium]